MDVYSLSCRTVASLYYPDQFAVEKSNYISKRVLWGIMPRFLPSNLAFLSEMSTSLPKFLKSETSSFSCSPEFSRRFAPSRSTLSCKASMPWMSGFAKDFIKQPLLVIVKVQKCTEKTVKNDQEVHAKPSYLCCIRKPLSSGDPICWDYSLLSFFSSSVLSSGSHPSSQSTSLSKQEKSSCTC